MEETLGGRGQNRGSSTAARSSKGEYRRADKNITYKGRRRMRFLESSTSNTERNTFTNSLCIHVAGKEQKSQDKGKFLEAK
jgi:hypothetical protein